MKYIILPESLSYSKAFSVEPTAVTSLWYALHSVPDPRRSQGKRYPLPVMLVLAILTFCCGQDSYEAMEEWPRNYQERLKKQVPFLAGYMPDASTFHRVFSRLDSDVLEEVLSSWIQEIVDLEDGEGIALDGKTDKNSGYHFVAAFAHIARSVLFQKSTSSKGKELVLAPDILKKTPLDGQIVTGDALFAQKNLCELITQKGGGFVFTVKGNQETLQDDIELFFKEPPWGARITVHETVDRRKGRVEKRLLECSTDLTSYINWPGVTHVFKITREVKRGGKTTTQTAVGIARLLDEKKPAEQIASLVRGHWQIENNLFRKRDVAFSEDHSSIRTGNGPHVLATLRNLVTTLFHQGSARSFASAQRRFAAHPEELFSFLGLPAHVETVPLIV